MIEEGLFFLTLYCHIFPLATYLTALSPLKKLEIFKIYMLDQNLILPNCFYIHFFVLSRNSSNFLMR